MDIPFESEASKSLADTDAQQNRKNKWTRVGLPILQVTDLLALLVTYAVSIGLVSILFFEWEHPHVENWSWFLLCLWVMLLPALHVTIALIIKFIIKIKTGFSHIYGIGFFGLELAMFLFIPSVFLGVWSPVESYTTDIADYGRWDRPSYDDFDMLLLPDHYTVRCADNSTYYYRCRAVFDHTSDIYVEYALDEEAFYQEIARVEKLFEFYEEYETEFSWHEPYQYTTVTTDNYICIFRHYSSYFDPIPFSAAEDDYSYTIFAYNPQTLRVRYLVCASGENGAEQPYYLELDW